MFHCLVSDTEQNLLCPQLNHDKPRIPTFYFVLHRTLIRGTDSPALTIRRPAPGRARLTLQLPLRNSWTTTTSGHKHLAIHDHIEHYLLSVEVIDFLTFRIPRNLLNRSTAALPLPPPACATRVSTRVIAELGENIVLCARSPTSYNLHPWSLYSIRFSHSRTRWSQRSPCLAVTP